MTVNAHLIRHASSTFVGAGRNANNKQHWIRDLCGFFFVDLDVQITNTLTFSQKTCGAAHFERMDLGLIPNGEVENESHFFFQD